MSIFHELAHRTKFEASNKEAEEVTAHDVGMLDHNKTQSVERKGAKNVNNKH